MRRIRYSLEVERRQEGGAQDVVDEIVGRRKCRRSEDQEIQELHGELGMLMT